VETVETLDTEMATEDAAPDFDQFFRSEYPRLLATMYLACGNRAEAEDLAQEAMARAFDRWARVSAAASPSGYVYAIAFNLNRTRLRRFARAFRREAHGVPTPSRDPSEIAVERADTARAIRSLSLRDRQALLLVEWLGMSSEEAAGVLGISSSSVRGRIHRARGVLSELIGGDDA
jgi:RNA polymerase sigma-70 factor, ECF subfamily